MDIKTEYGEDIKCKSCIHYEVCEWCPSYDDCDNSYMEKRPHGEWIKYIRCIECSVCKNKFFAEDENENCQDYDPCTDLRFNFCPNCGADMRGDKT